LEAVPSGQGKEGAQETVTGGPGKEGSTDGPGTPSAGGPQDPGSGAHGALEAGAEVPSALVGPLAEPSTVGQSRERGQSLALGGAAAGAPAAMVLARRPGDLSCELSALEGRMPPTCSAGLIGNQRLLSTSSIGFGGPSDPLGPDAVTGAPVDGGHGGSAVVRLPVSPAPGPAPSGVSGGSAAGTSGLALSGFLTLAGLLLLAAPRAQRRLRLSCQPWRTACFVLIPERPG
jgi:hypothetical protein